MLQRGRREKDTRQAMDMRRARAKEKPRQFKRFHHNSWPQIRQHVVPRGPLSFRYTCNAFVGKKDILS